MTFRLMQQILILASITLLAVVGFGELQTMLEMKLSGLFNNILLK